MSYFTNYPTVNYKFGNEQSSTKVQDIGAYVDLIDRVKDDISYYEEYNLRNGDRPDQVSNYLYGSPDYYWTFFLLNDDLKMRGWPLTQSRISDKAKEEYPNITLSTRANLSTQFLVGSAIQGQTSGVTGKILRRRPDMGQIIVEKTATNQTFTGTPDTSSNLDIALTTENTFVNSSDWVITNTTTNTTVTDHTIVISTDKTEATIGNLSFGYNYQIVTKILTNSNFVNEEFILTTENEVSKNIKIDRVVDEYNAKHHYEDANGRYVDINPNAPFIQRISYDITWDTLGTDSTNFEIDKIRISNLSSIFTDFSLSEILAQEVLGNRISGGSALTTIGELQTAFNNDDTYTVDDWQSGFLNDVLGVSTEYQGVTTEYLAAIVNGITEAGGTVPTNITYHTFSLVDNQLNLYSATSNTPQYSAFEFRSDTDVNMTTISSGAYESLAIDTITANDVEIPDQRNFVIYKTVNFANSSLPESPILDNKTTGETGTFDNNSTLVFVQNEFETYISNNFDAIIPAALTPVTFLERYEKENEEVKTIKVLKSEIVSQFEREFRKVLSETSSEEVATYVGDTLGISSFTSTVTNTAVPASSGGSSY